MIQFLETICSENGTIKNLEYHQKRLDSVAKHYLFKKKIILEDILHPPMHNTKLRCRVLYDSVNISITYHPYSPKKISKFKTIEISPEFDYSFKYANRDYFHSLHSKYPDYDEFILVQNGFVTDCTIANLAFFDTKLKEYITPSTPLLKGTTRARLLESNKISSQDIRVENLKKYDSLILLNAMLGFFEVKNAIIH